MDISCGFPLRLLRLELYIIKALIDASPFQELLMTTLFHDPAFLQNNDFCRIFDRGKPVGDHKNGPAGH